MHYYLELLFDYFVVVMYELFIQMINEEEKERFLFLHFDVETGETGIC
jgi:hypothetical protein